MATKHTKPKFGRDYNPIQQSWGDSYLKETLDIEEEYKKLLWIWSVHKNETKANILKKIQSYKRILDIRWDNFRR